MHACLEALRGLLSRLAVFGAAFGTSATLMLAVGSAFYSVSNGPVLADSAEARLAVARCDALGERAERRQCLQRLVAEAQARDAGAAQLAATSARPGGARR